MNELVNWLVGKSFAGVYRVKFIQLCAGNAVNGVTAISPSHYVTMLTMDTGEALDNNGSSSQVSWLQRCVFPAAALAIVLITHNTPLYTVCL